MTELELTNFCYGKTNEVLMSMYKNITGYEYVDENDVDDEDDINNPDDDEPEDDNRDCFGYKYYKDDNDREYDAWVDRNLL